MLTWLFKTIISLLYTGYFCPFYLVQLYLLEVPPCLKTKTQYCIYFIISFIIKYFLLRFNFKISTDDWVKGVK